MLPIEALITQRYLTKLLRLNSFQEEYKCIAGSIQNVVTENAENSRLKPVVKKKMVHPLKFWMQDIPMPFRNEERPYLREIKL
ncbi:hypothetical protein [Chryseobacterium sp. MMS23-Vi53]|uniref:hypothetical protein n=1 Tax=Chryseobacterium sp. MMS23-Vi53 TaxID=3386644 RepID=UPI0039EC1705